MSLQAQCADKSGITCDIASLFIPETGFTTKKRTFLYAFAMPVRRLNKV